MHSIHEHCEIIRIDVRCNAVTEIEYVSRSVTITGQHPRNTLLDCFRRFPKYCRVEISLKCNLVTG